MDLQKLRRQNNHEPIFQKEKTECSVRRVKKELKF
jgi:hypothetical protein